MSNLCKALLNVSIVSTFSLFPLKFLTHFFAKITTVIQINENHTLPTLPFPFPPTKIRSHTLQKRKIPWG